MQNKTLEHKRARGYAALIAGMTGILTALGATGGGRSEAPDGAASTLSRPPVVMEQPATPALPMAPVAALDIAAPQAPDDAPTLAETYPALASGALAQARLMTLPDGVLLQAEGLAITTADLHDTLAQSPAHVRDQMRRYALLILEQQATEPLLVLQARKRLGGRGLPEDRLLQVYFEELTSAAFVSESEIEAFYNQNSAMMGGAALAQIRPRIREHLLQEKRQEMVEGHIREIGRDQVIGLSDQWVKEQAAVMMDNPVDHARASGKPTFASFGADSCMPCQMMAPFRDEINDTYGDVLNVVYVHVNKDQLLASRYGVRGIPHVIFFDAEGREVHAHTGFMTLEQIKEWLEKSGVPTA